MKLAASLELHSYWNLLRGARSAPERSEIDPGAIRGVLADTLILEVDTPKGYPIRIAGARTNALFARELKGSAFLDLWQAPDRSEIAAMLAGVTGEALGVVAGVSASPPGLQPLELELLLLPLRHCGNTHSRILGACSPAWLPSWMGLLPAAPMNLLSLRVLGRAPSAPVKRLASAWKELPDGVDFGRTPQVDRRRHLFVFTTSSQPR